MITFDIMAPTGAKIIARVPLVQFAQEVDGWRDVATKPPKSTHVLLDNAGDIWRAEECRAVCPNPSLRPDWRERQQKLYDRVMDA